MNAILAILKKIFLKDLATYLFWSLVYKGVERAVIKLIRKAEEKGWTRGYDADEKTLAKLMLALIKGEDIPEDKRLILREAVVGIIYGVDN
jgi:hypothetical protein